MCKMIINKYSKCTVYEKQLNYMDRKTDDTICNEVYAAINLNSDKHGTTKFEKLRCMH